MSASLEIIICGFKGRMGQAIAQLASQDSTIQIVGATTKPGDPEIGKKLENGAILSDSLKEAVALIPEASKPVIIDFSVPSNAISHAQLAAKNHLPLIIGTTGLTAQQMTALEQAAEETPVLVAANMSLGANVLYALTRFTAQFLKDADVEISEIHHKGKKDSPSGTALQLAKTVAEARNQNIETQLVLNRSGHGARKSGEIGVVGLRAGNASGDHSVFFFGNHEHLELKHHVDNKAVFAEGALKAAQYLAQQKAGLHNMMDVLGIKTP